MGLLKFKRADNFKTAEWAIYHVMSDGKKIGKVQRHGNAPADSRWMVTAVGDKPHSDRYDYYRTRQYAGLRVYILYYGG